MHLILFDQFSSLIIASSIITLFLFDLFIGNFDLVIRIDNIQIRILCSNFTEHCSESVYSMVFAVAAPILNFESSLI